MRAIFGCAVVLYSQAVVAAYNKHRDSPFAVLAKDNDVMWRFGGRPDDITVQVAILDTSV